MKKVLRYFGSLCLALSLVISLVPMVSASEAEKAKIPDAFNEQLEKEKLLEYSEKNASKLGFQATEDEWRIPVDPSNPLVLEFDDGSTITYTSKVIDLNSDTSPSAKSTGMRTFQLMKSYTYLVGYAKITSQAEHVTTLNDPNTLITAYYLSSDTSDVNQYIDDTGFASVTTGTTKGKELWATSFIKAIRVQAKGTILYDIGGVTKQQSYEFVWQAQADQDSGFPFLVSSY